MMRPEKKPAALFDFDGTLIRGDSVVRFILFALKRGALKRREAALTALFALCAKLGLCSMEKAKERALRFERKMSPRDREKLCRDFVSRILVPNLFPEGRKAWDALRAEGRIMALASASTEDYMRYVAEALGADALICTQVHEDGTVGPNCRGPEKARRVTAWAGENDADLGASDAYGDSGGDVFMLRLCVRAHAVNCRRRLKKEALKQGWDILTWK